MRASEFLTEAGAVPIYYFAYGMLTDPKIMRGADFVGTAVLKNFEYEMFQYANVNPQPGSHVVGVLWALDRRMLSQLDRTEGYPDLYDRKTVPVYVDGNKVVAELYTMTPETREHLEGTKPRKTYVARIARGYQAAGVPMSQLVNSIRPKQPVAESPEQNTNQIRQQLNAWMNQDQQFKDPTQRAGFQAKVWPYIEQNINTILSDKGADGKGSYPAAPYAAWLLVQHMDAYPQNQGKFLQQLTQSGLDPTDGKDGVGKLQFLKDRYEVNKWILQNANNKEYFINNKPLPNPTVNVRNPAMFKDAGQVATSRQQALDNAIEAGNKLLVAAVQAPPAKLTQPSYKSGVAEGRLNEFAPGAGDDGEEETLHKYARMWYNGDDATQQKVEAILDRMGWEIGELESEEGGCFVVRAGDENGNSYIGFSPADLTEGVAEEKCPHCGGPMFSELMMNEKKDACYYKVKSRYKVWPSAYASGALVKCRKKGADSWGNKATESLVQELEENLHDWFHKEKWVRMDTKGNIKGDCAREPGEGKPKCLPAAKAHALGKKGRASAAQRKRRQDPNPERQGAAINVATKKRTNEVTGTTPATMPPSPAAAKQAQAIVQKAADNRAISLANIAGVVPNNVAEGSADWPFDSVNEVSDATLTSYKEKARQSAEQLSAAGKHRAATDRYGNIMKATGRQIDRTTKNIARALGKK